MAQETAIPGASQQQQQTAAGSVDIISDLLREAHAADTQAAQAVKSANQPVAGGHSLPQSVNLPGNPNHQYYDIDTRPVVGHHNAQMRGIVNLSKGVSNLIGQVDAAKAQKNTQRLAVNIERLMGAVQSSDQAKQVLANDPNNADAKRQLQQAGAIQDEILSDDKIRKSIGKAYNISFTDPKKNDTPEHAALKQATDSFSSQFQRQLPTNLQQDPARVAQAQVATAQAKATHDLVDKIAPALIRQQTDIERANIAAKSRTDAATIKAQADAEKEANRQKFTWMNDRQKAQDALHRVMVGANEHMRLAAFNQDRMDDRFFKGLDQKLKAAGGNLKDMKTSDLQHALAEADSIEAKDPQALSNFISIRDEVQKGQGKKFNKGDLEQANHAIYYFKQNQEAHQKARVQIQDELNRRLGVTSGTAGQQSGATTTSTAAAAKPVANLGEVDPDNDSDDSDDE